MLLTQTSSVAYDKLCRLDVLGLEDSSTGDQGVVYEEFKEKLWRNKKGWYETGLPWILNHSPLPSNKEGSLCRLGSLFEKLDSLKSISDYHEIIQEQLETGVVEYAPDLIHGREFYIPIKELYVNQLKVPHWEFSMMERWPTLKWMPELWPSLSEQTLECAHPETFKPSCCNRRHQEGLSASTN